MLDGILPAPRGVPQIEVTFDIDANGIVNVGARDKATGKEQAIRIQASGGLSDADIEKMVKDAEMHAAEDRARREEVEVRNQADSLIYTTEKNLAEYGDQVPAEEKAAIEESVAALKTATEGGDVGDIKTKTETLAQAAMKLGEAMYKAQQEEAEAGAPGADPAPQSGEDDSTIVDAEFEEVDEERKDKSA
jgi:molecular chaperone DnaK